MKSFILIALALLFSSKVLAGLSDPITLTTWKFSKGQNDDAFKVDFNDANWENVNVPHDWAITGPFIPGGDGNTAKLPWKGEAWYRYHWTMPQFRYGSRMYIQFDGVMAFPQVYINGVLVGKWDYGYNSFYIDITDYIHRSGENIIAVHADTRQHDSRWYPGAGIFRKVQLIPVNDVHAEPWGIQITTPIVKSNYARVNVIVPVKNLSTSDSTITVMQIMYGVWFNELSRITTQIKVPVGQTKNLETNFTLTDPVRWDIDEGNLYSVYTIIMRDDIWLDHQWNFFGVRTIRFTPDDGFYLNDHRVQIKGVCLHHDLGLLGAAFDEHTMLMRLSQLKEMGCNAIRTSHNVPAPELLEWCDKLGILVLDEIFDKYDRKADIVDTTNFDTFVERNVGNFVRRDRNHPCIFLWSVGNEIGDVQWNINGGFDKLRKMVNTVKQYDATRPVTLVCDSRNSAALRHFDYYDVHSWNYGRRYDLARQLEPNKAVIISESASTVSTRGFYEWPLPKRKTDFTKSLQVSSFDLNAPEWAEIPDDDFMWQQEENYVAGEFVWTGFDYLGEPTPYDPWSIKNLGLPDSLTSVSSYFGIFDLVGLPKDRYYLYKSYWNKEDTTIHILPHWNWKGMEGDTIPVFVYTNGDCAELFLNGKSLGKRCKKPDSQNSVERFRLMWNDVVYQPGELKAVAYKEGRTLGEEIIRTAGEPKQLKLSTDQIMLLPGWTNSFFYITVEALDKNNYPCPEAADVVSFEIAGPGRVFRTGNGNPQSTAPFQSQEVKLFHGKAVVIIESSPGTGALEITAFAKGLKDAKMSIPYDNATHVK